MATKITYILEVDDKGKVKVDGLTKGFVNLDNAIKKVNNDLREQAAVTSQANKATGGLISDAGLAGATLTELGRTVSDFNYGIRGMANNLSQLSTLFITLVSKRGGGVAGFTAALSQLGSQLMGPLGIILLIQGVITAIENFSIANQGASNSIKELNNEFEKQMRILRTITGAFSGYAAASLTAEEKLSLLRKEFSEFDDALKLLGDNIDPHSLKVQELIQDFERLLEVRSEIAITAAKIDAESSKEKKNLLEIERLNKTLLNLMLERNDLEDKFVGMSDRAKENAKDIAKFVGMAAEEYKNILASALKRDVSFASVFGDPFEQEKFDEFMKELEANLPDFIDDIDEYVDNQLLTEGRVSLTEKLLGLEEDSLEKDLKALKAKYDPILYQTDEFLRLEQAIRDKWSVINEKKQEQTDEKVRAAKAKHRDLLLSSTSEFFNQLALLDEKNKDLARLSIIANGAAASIGIWASYFDLASPDKGSFALAGTIAAQAALVASTAVALNSINSETPIGGAGSAATGSSASPQFNVVGQEVGQMGQLASAITGQTGEPVRAYVVLDDVNSAAELDNKITTSGSIG